MYRTISSASPELIDHLIEAWMILGTPYDSSGGETHFSEAYNVGALHHEIERVLLRAGVNLDALQPVEK